MGCSSSAVVLSCPPERAHARRLIQAGGGRGDRARTCNNRFWRPVLFLLSYAPRGIWSCRLGKEKAHRVRLRAYGGLLVSEGLVPSHETHLPAAEDDRVLLGPLAARGLERSIERAVPGIHRQRHFDGVQGPHGLSFVRGLPPCGAEPFRIHTHIGHVQSNVLAGSACAVPTGSPPICAARLESRARRVGGSLSTLRRIAIRHPTATNAGTSFHS